LYMGCCLVILGPEGPGCIRLTYGDPGTHEVEPVEFQEIMNCNVYAMHTRYLGKTGNMDALYVPAVKAEMKIVERTCNVVMPVTLPSHPTSIRELVRQDTSKLVQRYRRQQFGHSDEDHRQGIAAVE
jgi:hypothetical protein